MSLQINEDALYSIPHDCLRKLQAVYDTLKTAEKKAADLLMSEPSFFLDATISEAAKKAGCSEATFVRLSKKLGYEGYPALKQSFSQTIQSDEVVMYSTIEENDSYHEVINKVFQSAEQTLKDTLEAMDLCAYSEAVKKISFARKILVCGAGDASSVAASAYQKMIRIGIDADFSDDIDTQLIIGSHLGKKDAVIVISHSGRTQSLVELVKQVKQTGATIISITNYPFSPLAKQSDIVLLTAAFDEQLKGEVMSKRIAELCIIESIIVNVSLMNKGKVLEKIKKSNRALEMNKI